MRSGKPGISARLTNTQKKYPAGAGYSKHTVEDGMSRRASEGLAMMSIVVYNNQQRKATHRAGVQHAQQKGFSNK